MAQVKKLQIKSDYFTLDEFICSKTADRLKIKNVPTAEIVQSLQYGVDMILEPLRRYMQSPVVITSGYRCDKLNTAVGGKSNSYHTKGMAADIHINSKEHAMAIMSYLSNNVSVDVALFEHSSNAQWIHVQWCISRNPRHIINYNYNA